MRNSVSIPSLEDYAKEKKRIKNNFDVVNCLDCSYCKPNLYACIFGKNVRNLKLISVCPKSSKKY